MSTAAIKYVPAGKGGNVVLWVVLLLVVVVAGLWIFGAFRKRSDSPTVGNNGTPANTPTSGTGFIPGTGTANFDTRYQLPNEDYLTYILRRNKEGWNLIK